MMAEEQHLMHLGLPAGRATLHQMGPAWPWDLSGRWAARAPWTHGKSFGH